jgi:hypothetical protein
MIMSKLIGDICVHPLPCFHGWLATSYPITFQYWHKYVSFWINFHCLYTTYLWMLSKKKWRVYPKDHNFMTYWNTVTNISQINAITEDFIGIQSTWNYSFCGKNRNLLGMKQENCQKTAIVMKKTADDQHQRAIFNRNDTFYTIYSYRHQRCKSHFRRVFQK